MWGQARNRTLEEIWGAQVCARCGESLVLGEGFPLRGSRRHEVVCADCAALPVAPRRAQVHGEDFLVAEDLLEPAA